MKKKHNNKRYSTRSAINCSNEEMMVAEGLRYPASVSNKQVTVKTIAEKKLIKDLKANQNPNFKGDIVVPFNYRG